MQRALEKTNREEERATRDVLESLARERRRDQAAELELQLKQVELAERLKADETAALRQEAVLADERERFMKLREELGSKFAMQEGETRRRHEESMARMALEREKKLAELDLLWRQRVQKEELGALQQVLPPSRSPSDLTVASFALASVARCVPPRDAGSAITVQSHASAARHRVPVDHSVLALSGQATDGGSVRHTAGRTGECDGGGAAAAVGGRIRRTRV
jgi:hypothetical protein